MKTSNPVSLVRGIIVTGALLATNAVIAKTQEPTMLEKASTVAQGIGERDAALATRYISPDFKNHTPAAYDGADGIKAFIGHLPPGKSPLTVVRAFQDGPYVFTQSMGNLFGQAVFFDIYKFSDGRIVEHWDNRTAATAPNDSGHTSIDGPTVATDIKDTDKNKALIEDFYKTIFLKGQFEKMGSYFDGDKFIRHDARGGDGLSALGALMQAQAKKGIVMKVAQIEKVLGEGNFVLVTASGSIADKPVAYYDLFRVEKNKILEHWDVIEDIPSASESKNSNGKF